MLRIANLSLLDNPIVSEPNFRAHVVKLLPQLTVLNFKKVSQKVCALGFFKDRIEKKPPISKVVDLCIYSDV